MGDLLIHPSASQRRITDLEQKLHASHVAIDTMRYHIASIVIGLGGSVVVPVLSPCAWELNASATEDGAGVLWTAAVKLEKA